MLFSAYVHRVVYVELHYTVPFRKPLTSGHAMEIILPYAHDPHVATTMRRGPLDIAANTSAPRREEKIQPRPTSGQILLFEGPK